jgi:hypothetical protein
MASKKPSARLQAETREKRRPKRAVDVSICRPSFRTVCKISKQRFSPKNRGVERRTDPRLYDEKPRFSLFRLRSIPVGETIGRLDKPLTCASISGAVARIVDHQQFASRPCACEGPSDIRRATDIQPAMDEDARNARELSCLAKQQPIFKPRGMPPVVGNKSRKRHAKSRIVIAWVRAIIRVCGDVRIFPRAPIPRGLFSDGWIRIMEQTSVSVGQATASLRWRRALAETLPSFREKTSRVTRDPLNLASACDANAEKDHFGNAFFMTLAISQCERGPPRSGEDQPSFYLQRRAQEFQIADEVLGCIRSQVCRSIARVRRASAAATLIEQNDAIGFWVEKSSPTRRAARAGTSVKDDRRLSSRVASHVPIDVVPVADVEHAAIEGFNVGI